MKRQIVNIVNFIRGEEPRRERDLILPVKEQIRLMNKHNLKGTFLIQYDALLKPEFTDLLKPLPKEQYEIGLWFEIVQQQAEEAGVEWKGKYSWDYRSNFAMPVGYKPEIRERLADISFNKFYDIFGYYPKSVGGWVLDAHTLKYISEKYGADAFCNCKDQYGTDGYTLWGGYYGQGYYPCKNNAFCPAQTDECQINTPLFRMLGSDPIYQYDIGLDIEEGPEKVQQVITLEPISGLGGGSPEWTEWYFKNNFSGNCLSFGYAQTGQENSFGWEFMQKGVEYQFMRLEELQKENKIEVEKLQETGKWYKNVYKTTPPSTIYAVDDISGKDCASIWYCCKNYRINIFKEKSSFRIRDLYVFSEDYRERYLDEVCEGAHSIYDNLPVTDGNALSGHGILGGIYFKDSEEGKMLECDDLCYEEFGNDEVKITAVNTKCGNLCINLSQGEISVIAENNFSMINNIDGHSDFCPIFKETEEESITLVYRGFEYKLNILQGRVDKNGEILSCENAIKISITVL